MRCLPAGGGVSVARNAFRAGAQAGARYEAHSASAVHGRFVSSQTSRAAGRLDDEAVAALAEDGLVEVENGLVRLPTTRGS